VNPSEIKGGVDVRSIYFYVLSSLKIEFGPQDQPHPAISKIAQHHLTRIDFAAAFSNVHTNAKKSLANLLTALDRGGLYGRVPSSTLAFEQDMLGCSWIGSVPALDAIPGHLPRVERLFSENPDQRIGDILGHLPSAQVIRGTLTGLMMQVAQEQDRLARKSDQQTRHVLMSSHRSVAGLAMLDLTARMPVHGDIVVYEFRTFPDGSVSLQESHVLPFPTDE